MLLLRKHAMESLAWSAQGSRSWAACALLADSRLTMPKGDMKDFCSRSVRFTRSTSPFARCIHLADCVKSQRHRREARSCSRRWKKPLVHCCQANTPACEWQNEVANEVSSDFLLQSAAGQTMQLPTTPDTEPSIPRESEAGSLSIAQEIKNLTIPALGAVLSDPLMSLIDTACVGQLGPVQLAALGPNTSIFNFVFQLFAFLGAATCNISAAYSTGSGRPDDYRDRSLKASRTLSHALVIALGLGVATTVLMEACAPRLLAMMGATSEIVGPATTYLRIRALSAPAVFSLIVCQGACLGRQDALTPLAIYAVAGVVNLLGDMVLTLGMGWGVAGAAWATLGAQCIASCLFIYVLDRRGRAKEHNLPGMGSGSSIGHKRSFLLKEPVCHPGQERLPAELAGLPTMRVQWHGLPSKETMKPFLELAAPLGLRAALGMSVYSILAKMAATTGVLELAAHQVAMQVFWTISYFAEPFSVAAQSLIARDTKSKPKRVRAMARTLLGTTVAAGALLAGMVVAVNLLCSRLWSSDPVVRTLVASVTPQSALAEWLCAICLAFEGIAIGSGKFAYLPQMQLLNLGIVTVALVATRSAGGGLQGIWSCFTLFFALRTTFHILYIWRTWTSNALGASQHS